MDDVVSAALLAVVLACTGVIGWMGHFPPQTLSEVRRYAIAALAFIVAMSATLGIIWLGPSAG